MDPSSHSSGAAMVFPLLLTPLEYYFWCDDRPEYPASFPIQLTFSGTLRRDAMVEAVDRTIQRHPLLGALVDPTGKWPSWIDSRGQRPFLDWGVADEPLSHPEGERIDLTQHVGLRIWVREGQAQTRVVLQFHHACCDGLAVEQFIEDLLVNYCLAINAGHERTKLRALDASQLRVRFPLGKRNCKRSLVRWLTIICVMIREWCRILLRTPSVLAVSNVGKAVPTSPFPLFDFATHTLDVGQLNRLKAVAQAQGVTANDLLLRDLFRVLQQWHVRHGHTSNPVFRINMPTNERDQYDRILPAANRVSFAFLTRRGRECADGTQLLSGIHRETEAIKRCRRGLYFLGGLRLAAGVRGLIPWFLKRPRSFATICLTNVGKVLRRTPLPRQGRRLVCGDAILERITTAPCIRPFTRAAIAVLAYANELTINLNCDRRYFTPQQRQEFLGTYVAALERTLAS